MNNIAAGVKKATRIRVFPIAFLVICMSCAKQKGDLVVAQVGDKTITLKEFQEFYDKLPEYFHSKKTGMEGERNHLQTMIDMELLTMESPKVGIDKSLAFLRKMNKAKKEKLVGIFQQRGIKIDVKEEEIQEFFEKHGFSRGIRFSDITVDSEDKVKLAFEEIKKGKSFEEVARKWSTNKETAPRGDDTERYSAKESITLIQDRLYSLKVGEVSEPIKIGSRYSIFKVVADTTMALGPELRAKISRSLYVKKFSLERAALVDKLKNKYRLELDQGGLNAFVDSLRNGASFETEDERNIVVYRYDRGKITAGDFIYVISDLKSKGGPTNFTDSRQAVSFAERALIPYIMIMEAAIRGGIDKEEDIAKWLEKKRRKFLIWGLRKKALEGKVNITEEEIRREYDSNPDNYMLPEDIHVQEILVETEAEALRLKEQIREGALLGELAGIHSIRPMKERDEEGRLLFHPDPIGRYKYGALVEAAQEAQIEVLKGPVKVKDGYSIFKVLSRKHERRPFSDAKRLVRKHIKKVREAEIFEQFLKELRNRYASQVNILEDNLKVAFKTE